jgi:hypothetical protein
VGCKSTTKNLVSSEQSAAVTETDKLWLKAVVIGDEIMDLEDEGKWGDPEKMAKLVGKVEKKYQERLTYMQNLKKFSPDQIQAILNRGMLVDKDGEPIVGEDSSLDGVTDSYIRLKDPETGEIAFRVKVKTEWRRGMDTVHRTSSWFASHSIDDHGKIKINEWRNTDGYELPDHGSNPANLDMKINGMRRLSEQLGLDHLVTFPRLAWIPVPVKGQAEPARALIWVRPEEALKPAASGETGIETFKKYIADERTPKEVRQTLQEYVNDIEERFEDRGGALKNTHHHMTLKFLSMLTGNADRHTGNYRIYPDGTMMGWDEDNTFLDLPDMVRSTVINIRNPSQEIRSTIEQKIRTVTYEDIAAAAKKANLSYTGTIWVMARLSLLKEHPDWMYRDDFDKRGFKGNDAELQFYSNINLIKAFMKALGLDFDKEYISGTKAKEMFKKMFKYRTVVGELNRKQQDLSMLPDPQAIYDVAIDREGMKITIKHKRTLDDLVDEEDEKRHEVKNFKVKYIEPRDPRSTMVTLISENDEWIYASKDGSSLEYCSKKNNGCQGGEGDILYLVND